MVIGFCLYFLLLFKYWTELPISWRKIFKPLLQKSDSCQEKTHERFLNLSKIDLKLNYENSSNYKANKHLYNLTNKYRSNKKTELLIIIKTRVYAFKNRWKIRESWAKVLAKLSPYSAIVFIAGEGSSEKLGNETKTHGDILQGNFMDSYHNLTLKLISALKFASETIKWINEPKIIVVMDDDVFVNVPLLLKRINDLNKKCEGPYLLGHLYTNSRVEHDPPTYQFSSKWGVPSYMLTADVYPHYLHGLFTIMSFESSRCLLKESFQLPYFHIDDVFITGYCAIRCGIMPTQFNGIMNGHVELNAFNPGYHIAFPANQYNSEMYKKVLSYYNITDHSAKV
ncbi:B3GALT1 [Lepeophtheirus salmonis]|uniref:Hexosyltransferase n=1 Tax=Lepeophtheirus salmonis TaxID=72036 RepID=A0A7R8H8V4_LEPSM|nr:B3GALT1 [Lepeophtheirus salmonis]CAF2944979.1 B3GALT1 [Lepeophtheirus salmonis]